MCQAVQRKLNNKVVQICINLKQHTHRSWIIADYLDKILFCLYRIYLELPKKMLTLSLN